jgi:hypothetical protein
MNEVHFHPTRVLLVAKVLRCKGEGTFVKDSSTLSLVLSTSNSTAIARLIAKKQVPSVTIHANRFTFQRSIYIYMNY